MSEQSALAKFLEQAEPKPFDKTNLFAPETDTPIVESEPEVAIDPIESEDNLPFDKNPKIQRFIEKQIEKRLSSVERPVERQQEVRTEKHSVVSAFEKIIGNDTPEKIAALAALQETMDSNERKVSYAEQIAEQQMAEEQESEQIDYQIDDGFESIQEKYNVNLDAQPKLKSQFIDFVKQIAPRDEDGEITALPNFVGAFDAFKKTRAVQSNTTNIAKTLASRTTQSNGNGTQPVQSGPVTFESIERMMSR